MVFYDGEKRQAYHLLINLFLADFLNRFAE